MQFTVDISKLNAIDVNVTTKSDDFGHLEIFNYLRAVVFFPPIPIHESRKCIMQKFCIVELMLLKL